MNKPALSDLAHYAEIIAAIAVIVSLIYVGRQVQDNTAAIRSSTMQAVANSSDTALQDQAGNADIMRVRMTGDADPTALTEIETGRYLSTYRGTWIRFQNIYAQQQLGVLDERFWYTFSRIICDVYDPPGVRATWDFHKAVLHPDFVAFVEACDEA